MADLYALIVFFLDVPDKFCCRRVVDDSICILKFDPVAILSSAPFLGLSSKEILQVAVALIYAVVIYGRRQLPSISAFLRQVEDGYGLVSGRRSSFHVKWNVVQTGSPGTTDLFFCFIRYVTFCIVTLGCNIQLPQIPGGPLIFGMCVCAHAVR
ncbi:unnamed protein product [Victoria cruziana]